MKLAPMAKERHALRRRTSTLSRHQVQAAYEGFATVILLCSKAVEAMDRRPQRIGDG
jgi:hypothetical protein